MNRTSEWVAGVDGCPGGWLVVLRHTGEQHRFKRRLCAQFSDVLKLEEAPGMIAVDIPIGLPDVAIKGGRLCDIETRRRLGGRQSSVFSVPSRRAVAQTDYVHACTVNLEHSAPPRKVSKQCFNLFPKIRDVDVLMTPALQERVYEVHPELAFWALNGHQPLELAKKIKSAPSRPGLALRRELLDKAGFPPAACDEGEWPRRLVGPDDIIDACALAWTAGRLLAGTAITLPADPPRDARGLRMEISA
jgi:predicted RNase H-like nuclease